MYCQNKIVYTVQAGDSLYKLSRQYKTTVTELILGNPGVNPYNLQVGMKLTICPGREYEQDGPAARPEMVPGQGTALQPGAGIMPGESVPGQGAMPQPEMMPGQGAMPQPGAGMMPGGSVPGQGRPDENESANEVENALENLVEGMRLAWLEHVYWMRMYLMSVTTDAPDQQAVEERAQQTADEITDVFARYLPINVTRQLRNLLMDHVELTGEIIRTLKSGDMSDYDALIKEWYGNANQIAALLGGQNPFFGSRETRNLLLNHLDLVREEIEYQINGEYGESIETFRNVVAQALSMADYFARGLLAR